MEKYHPTEDSIEKQTTQLSQPGSERTNDRQIPPPNKHANNQH